MPLFESFASFFANLSPRSQRAEDHQTVLQPEQPSTPPHIRLGYSPFTSRSDNHYPGVAAAQSADIAHSEVCIDPDLLVRVLPHCISLCRPFGYNFPSIPLDLIALS